MVGPWTGSQLDQLVAPAMAFWEVGIIIDRPKPEKTALRELGDLGTWGALLVCAVFVSNFPRAVTLAPSLSVSFSLAPAVA